MNTDIRVALDFFDHRKTRKLIGRYGLEAAWGLLRLWASAARDRPSGLLRDWSAEDVVMEMRLDGKQAAEEILSFLVECRWVDVTELGYQLHDWHEHNPWAAEFQDRSDAGRFARLARTHPIIYKELQAQGVKSLSRERYWELKSIQRNVNDPLTDGQRNVKPALTPAPAPVPVPKSKDMSKTRSRAIVNPSVHVLLEHLKSAFEKRFGSEPVMNYPGISKQLKRLLETDRFTESALKELIDWYLTTPKAEEHPTPAAALSADTVQRWQIACPEVR